MILNQVLTNTIIAHVRCFAIFCQLLITVSFFSSVITDKRGKHNNENLNIFN